MITIDDAYEWLNKFDESPLGLASQGLIKRLQEALNAGRTDQAWALVAHLKTLAGQNASDNMESGEIYVECGLAAYKLGKCDEAIQLLENALTYYVSHPHQIAVVKWILGRIYCADSSKGCEGIKVWDSAIAGFDRLARSKVLSSRQAQWYQEQWIKMKLDLQDEIDKY